MYPVIGRCPVCEQMLEVTRLYCRRCDTAIEGHFHMDPFYELSPEQRHFVETFVRCQGKLNRVQDELGVSYPTVRNRLHDVIRALGYEADEEEGATRSEQNGAPSQARWMRIRVTDLDTGRAKVNVNLPMGLVNFGMKMGARFAPEMEKVSLEEMMKAVKEGAQGKIIEVEDEEDNERVQIYIE
jgi:hypothetical protein